VRWWVAFGFAAALAGCDRLWGLFPLHELPPAVDATTSDVPPPQACPSEYSVTLPTSTSKYRVETSFGQEWTVAANSCEDDSIAAGSYTHLLVLTDLTEWSELLEVVGRPPDYLWIGYHDRITAEKFEWVTAEATAEYPPMMPPWEPANPDHMGPGCVTYRPGTGQFAAELADGDCNSTRGFICECDGYPDLHRR
jgi:hypothetical protein